MQAGRVYVPFMSLTIEFDIEGNNPPGAIYELQERLRELVAEAIQERWLRADGVEIVDFVITLDEACRL